jgi:EAL domain-containing protein (putative c-di-GMP-specific phosphodiesterase class I)
MGVFDQLQADRIVEIVAELVAADHGEGASLGDFNLRRDENGRLIGDFHHARLSSVFQPVLSTDGGRVLGHTARVRCETSQGSGISPWGVFSMIASDTALVRLDRLCRALHLLNYFDHASTEWLLWLRVETRLLVSVKQDHGKVFGHVMEHYCGIPTSRVVIELPPEATERPEALAVALANYRARGYRTAVNHHARLATDVLKFADFVHIGTTVDRAALAQTIAQAHTSGASAIVKKVESEPLRTTAVNAGADGLQGFLFGAPAFDLATHASVRAWNAQTVAA